MEMKGSKCTCLPKFGASIRDDPDARQLTQQQCGTYCKYLSAKQQRNVILRLIRSEQTKQMVRGTWEPRRYLIN